MANKRADLFEALRNENNGAPPNMRTKALIRQSRRLIALLESEIKEKEQESLQDVRALEALLARD